MNRWAARGAAALVLAAVLWSLGAPYAHRNAGAVADRTLSGSDFGAFYCAASIARERGNPYAFEALRRCETERVYVPGGTTYAHMGIDPAPLPLYDLAFFAPFTWLTYRTAGIVWIVMLLLATLCSAAILCRLTTLPYALTLAALAVTDGTLCIAFGQEQPLVTLALVTAALLLRAGRTNAAVFAASFTLIEPHVGLPAMLALLVWTRARAAVVVSLAAFAGVALAFGGLDLNLEYFLRVLPAHAFAEIPVWFQYSLTSVLHAAGVPDALALRIASVQYALTAAAAIACAGPLARQIGKPALVLFPAACAVLGGPFIHITQIASAIPFALYLATSAPVYSLPGWTAAVLLGLQWPSTSRALEVVAIVLVAGAALAVRLRLSLALRLCAASAVLALYFAINHGLQQAPFESVVRPLSHARAVAATASYDASLASTQLAIDARESPDLSEQSTRRFVERLPGWLGLLLVLGAGVASIRPAIIRSDKWA